MNHKKSILKKTKYVFIFLAVCVLLMVVGMIVILGSYKVASEKYLKCYSRISGFYNDLGDYNLQVQDFISSNLSSVYGTQMEKSFSSAKSSVTLLYKERAGYDQTIRDNVDRIYTDFQNLSTDMNELRKDYETASTAYTDHIHSRIVNIMTTAYTTLESCRVLAENSTQAAGTAAIVCTIVMILGLCGFVAFGVYCCYYVKARIVSPIDEIVGWAKLFEEGYDEMRDLEYNVDDEYSELVKSFNIVKQSFVEANKLKKANEMALRKLHEEEEYKKNFVKKLYDEKREKESISNEAKRDGLTGLYNRRSFDAMVEDFLRKKPDGVCGALYLIDMDNFKNVNDTLGHIAGDEALKRLAGAMRVVFPGAFLGRYGGDEFVVFLTTGNNEIFNNKAKELCAKMNHDFAYGDKSVHLSVSVGVASTEGMGDYSELYMFVDRALYYSKEHGRNQYKNAADLEDEA